MRVLHLGCGKAVETNSAPLPHMAEQELAMLRADGGRLLGFVRAVARRA